MSDDFQYDVFLSHSSKDKAVVRTIAVLLKKGGLKVWFDEWTLKPGDNIPMKIEEGLEHSRVLVLCMSANAFDSDWAQLESGTFRFRDPLNKHRRLIPLRLDDSPIKGSLAQLVYINWLPENREKDNAKLIQACRLGSSTPVKSQRMEVGIRSKPIQSESVPVIAIVGMGFAGTTTAVRLMQLASVPIKLLLFEQNKEQRFGGLAYGVSNLGREHYLNIHAGRISMFRERPDDFLKWATEDADRSKMFEVLQIPNHEKELWNQKLKFTEFSAVPRLIYQMYLQHRFEEAAELAKSNVSLEWFNTQVSDVNEILNGDRILTRLHFDRETSRHFVDVDAAILCTGHLQPLLPSFTSELREHPSFFTSPYDPSYIKGLLQSSAKDSLLIIGSGLSAYDAAISALNCDFKGKITMCSRNGFRHDTYPSDHSHRILSSTLFDGHFQPPPRTALDLSHVLRNAFDSAKALFKDHFPREDRRVIPERVLKAIEPYIARFVQDAPAEQVKELLRQNKSWFTTMRTSVVPIVSSRVIDSHASFLTKQILDITRIDNATLCVQFANNAEEPSEQHFTKIVCCTGYDADYLNATGLWKSLMQKVAIPHLKTGLGIAVGDNGRIQRKWDKSLSRSIYAVGTMRQGDEIERRGRIGAFTFSIGTIRNQCLMAALSILKNKEMPEYSRLAQAERDNLLKQKLFSLLGTTGEVRRRFNSVVSDIAEAQFLPKTQRRDEWVSELQERLYKLLDPSEMRPGEIRLMRHTLWHFARMEAGRRVTDIRRLSERYAIVRSYRPGVQNLCVLEKKECKDRLKRIMSQMNAKSISLSVYHEHARCLYPFVDHLRLNRFTPTPYGASNAGRLVRAYLEEVNQQRLFSDTDFFPDKEIKSCYINGRLAGIIIPDYNVTRAKKEHYNETPRLYPQVLAVLVLDMKSVVGVVYLEATRTPAFRLSDVERVHSLLGKIPSLLSRVIPAWDPREDTDFQDQNCHGVRKEPKTDLSHFNFTNCNLEEAIMNDVILTNAVLNGAQCKRASFNHALMRGAQMIGTDFEGASRVRANLTAATIVGAKFNSNADLTECVMDATIVEKTSFAHAVMTNAKISSVAMRNVDFSGASLRKAQLTNLSFDSSCRWTGANLTDCVIDQTTYQNLPDEIIRAFGLRPPSSVDVGDNFD